MLTDPNSGIDVLVQRTRARGIVSGSLENGTILKYVKRSEDIQEGDRLLTSGTDGVFPKGMMVGHRDQSDQATHRSVSIRRSSSRGAIGSHRRRVGRRRGGRRRKELS